MCRGQDPASRLRWFGHVELKEENDWVKKCTMMINVTIKWWAEVLQGKHGGVVSRGDMKAMDIKEEIAQDRCAWRNITGVRPVLARMPDSPYVCLDSWSHGPQIRMINSSFLKTWMLPLEFCS